MFNALSKYEAFAFNALKEKYAYRFKSVMWSLSTLFNMLVQYFLWKTIYAESSGAAFMGIEEKKYMIYISFGVVFYNITSCMENMIIAEDIKSGNIAMNLCKPISYKTMVFFRHIGGKLGEIFGLIPLIFVAVLLSGSAICIDIKMIFSIISIIIAFFLAFTFSYIIGLITFWTTNYWGIQFLANSIMGLFSGQLVSISFYKEIGKGLINFNTGIQIFQNPIFTDFFWILGKIAYMLPFQSMYYTPMSIFSGIISEPKKIVGHILLQCLWLLILTIVSHIMWKKAQKRISILGG